MEAIPDIPRPPGIVVGYDGSSGGEQAVYWASREARDRGCHLTVCVATGDLGPAASNTLNEPDSDELLDAGMRLARRLLGSEELHPLLLPGRPVPVLCGLGQGADIVVVGSHGRGGMPGMAIGSVGLYVAAHAPGPVVIVRGHWEPGQHASMPVVVGSDGSAGSAAAVRFCFEEASLRDTWLLAVCALADQAGALGNYRQIEASFNELIEECRKKYPEVAVTRKVSAGPARSALLQASSAAQIVAVGARGRGGLDEMALGSVSIAVASYASCPAAIVR